MRSRPLGDSDLRVSEVTLGTTLTRTTTPAVLEACVRAALDAGVTTFETAAAHVGTLAQRTFGDALAGQPRESLQLLTTVDTTPGTAGRGTQVLSPEHVRTSLEVSLRHLRTDHVDVYQVVGYDHLTPLETTMQAFADVVHAGLVRAVGVGRYWSARRLRAAHALAEDLGVPLLSLQPTYSPLRRSAEAELLPTARTLRVSSVVRTPPEPLPRRDGATPGPLVERLRPVLDELGLTVADLPVVWLLARDDVASVIVGGYRPGQVGDRAAAADVVLSTAALARLDDALGADVVR